MKPLQTHFSLLFLSLIFLQACIGTDVVEIEEVPPEVKFTSTTDSLALGDMFHFMAEYFNEKGMLTDNPIDWTSSDPDIISINAAGVSTGLMEGSSYIIASSGPALDSMLIVVAEDVLIEEAVELRPGTFTGKNNYNVQGTAELSVNDMDEITLDFLDDFRTSNGPGLYVYLSNNPRNVNSGIELGELKEIRGVQTYDVPSNISLFTYEYVLVYCKPFGAAFGCARLEN